MRFTRFEAIVEGIKDFKIQSAHNITHHAIIALKDYSLHIDSITKTGFVEELKNFSTLRDITDSNQEGRREIDIKLKPRAYALGLQLRDVARQVRQGFFGQEIQRIQRGKNAKQ